MLLPTILIISLLMGISVGCGSATSEATPIPPSPTPQPPTPTPTPEGDPVKGSPDAPVTIEEYSDYQCPACAFFAVQVLPLLEEEYIDTGKALLIFHDFQFHPQAPLAAHATECAREQDRFWEMHDTLFTQQKEWSGNQDAPALFIQYANDSGLDTDAFNACMNSGRHMEEIQTDLEKGREAGVDATPYFFVNGEPVRGANLELLVTLIEKALNE